MARGDVVSKVGSYDIVDEGFSGYSVRGFPGGTSGTHGFRNEYEAAKFIWRKLGKGSKKKYPHLYMMGAPAEHGPDQTHGRNPVLKAGGRYEVYPSSNKNPIRVEMDSDDIADALGRGGHGTIRLTLTFFPDGRFSHLDSYQASQGATPFPKWSERDRALLIQYAAGWVQDSLGVGLGAARRPLKQHRK